MNTSAIDTARTVLVLNAYASGMSLAAAYDSVLGEGASDSLAAEIVAALRAKRATLTTEAAQ